MKEQQNATGITGQVDAGVRRVQRKRIKGWKMPKNTIYVGRPSAWGNPFKGADAYYIYEAFLGQSFMSDGLRAFFSKNLKGKNLACWCSLDQPCHADILIEVANA